MYSFDLHLSRLHGGGSVWTGLPRARHSDERGSAGAHTHTRPPTTVSPVLVFSLLVDMVRFVSWALAGRYYCPSGRVGDQSITPRTVLGGAQLVHLGHALLELDILALLVAVALVLVVGGGFWLGI